ncbi:hypothetical protein LDENG_00249300 [Lucifuga dentata]|nr:hypothetical protein LDENG_00249300 [Lucifuga dentata]
MTHVYKNTYFSYVHQPIKDQHFRTSDWPLPHHHGRPITAEILMRKAAECDTSPPPDAMTTGHPHSSVQSGSSSAGPNEADLTVEAPPPCICSVPEMSVLVQDQQEGALWRREVLDLLSQLVQVQREAAGGQVEVVKLLGMLGNQGSQKIMDLHNLARHQSLLVENHQALLLQVSRIAVYLQDLTKKPLSGPPLTSHGQ